jgi:hypothetical protein
MIWDIEHFIKMIGSDFEEGAIQDIKRRGAMIKDDYFDESTLRYFMYWYYALVHNSSDPERNVNDNRSCAYCVQKSKLFAKQLISYVKQYR